ncbi:MAG: hypothetical protein LBI79_09405 [Nitrososphaerota archaeon]|jgi:late competence protein required for DNA uptake (superfamily II DNA/RNA helicase)|nr:hypothetical protein [Nitrososphaerota archaeon]
MKKVDSIRDFFKNTKHRKPTLIFCPRCCSPKIQLSHSLDVWLTPKQYYCENCGYLGTVVMELEEDPEINQDKEKEENALDSDKRS